MVSAIGSSSASDAAFTIGTSAAGIEAQLTRYKKELSDCVNCASAETTAGKAAIEAIANKISSAEARIDKLSASKLNNPPEASKAVDDSKAVALETNLSSLAEPLSLYRWADSAAGSRIDIFA